MQSLRDLPTQILVGVIVNAIIGILYWLLKREFLSFKRNLRIPQYYKLKLFPKRKNNYVFQRPLDSALSLSTALNTSSFIPQKKNV